MKLLLYMGSPRYKGNTSKLLNEFTHILDSKGVEYHVESFGNVHPCVACGKCASLGECIIKDDWSKCIREFKEKYDGLVLFTPIYFFQFSSQTKMFIDRLGGSNGWEGKIISLVTASGSSGYFGGNDLLVESMKRTSEYNGCHYIKGYNKVTNDKILSISKKDTSNLEKLAERILRCYNEVSKKERT